MNAVTKADVGEATRTALAELALGDPELLGESLELRAELQRRSGLDPRSFALVKIAALMALDAPPAFSAPDSALKERDRSANGIRRR